MTEYAVLYLNRDGRWVALATFREPLDADTLYEMMLAMHLERPIRLVRWTVLAGSQEE